MKKFFILLSAFISICVTGVKGQSFVQLHDTMYINTAANVNIYDTLSILSSGGVTLEWKVIESDFPADWIAATGICDNKLCYPSSSLWPSGSMQTSNPYASGIGDFHMQFDGTSVSNVAACHYMKVRLNNKFAVSDTAIAVFKVCRMPSKVASIPKLDDMQLYPNPATTEINVVYDAGADVRNIALYNIIGKVMSVYRVSGNSANLNLDNVPSGIYFLRLMNSNGQVVGTRKFTKQ